MSPARVFGPRFGLVAILALGGLAAAACSTSGLSIVQDDRVDIVQPDDRSEVELPVQVRWTVEDFEVGRGKGSFGVFVDRPVQPPGKTLGWLFRNDDSCRGIRGCPDEAFLNARNIFRTTATSVTVESVVRDTNIGDRRQFHELTVVLLDERGRRVGEGAWSVQFEVEED